MALEIPPYFLDVRPNPRYNLMVMSRPDGFSVFQVNPLRELHRRYFENSVGCLQAYLLENTSLFALVLDTTERLKQKLAGQPLAEMDRELNPNNLVLFDDEKGVILARLKFSASIIGVKLTKRYIFVCLPQEIQIYGIKDLTLFDTVPVFERSWCFEAIEAGTEQSPVCILAYASPTAYGRLGLNFYAHESNYARFIDVSVSELTFIAFSATGKHVLVGSKNGKVIKRFSTVSQQLTGLYKRSSEPAAIRWIDCISEHYVVCSDKGTIHVFKVEPEGPLEFEDFGTPKTDKLNQRIRETRSHAAFKAVRPGIRHLAVFAPDCSMIAVVSADNEYQKVEFYRTGGQGKLLSRWEFY